MSFYIEPVYLNEKMVLNCAAYMFKGVAMESEVSEGDISKKKGSLNLGFKFLQEFLSPVSASGVHEKEKNIAIKSARRYTLGGLHMSLIDALAQEEKLVELVIEKVGVHESYVESDVILKPVDFYSIIESLNVAAPLIFQSLQGFGDKFAPKVFTKKVKDELPKYKELISKALLDLENDYLKSGQLEMIMISPVNGKQIGIVDIDVSELTALSVKAKLTDGRFKVIGRVSRHIDANENMSLVQRTVLSSILNIVEKLALLGGDIEGFEKGMNEAKKIAQQICQLHIPGPAVRIMAMSICI